MLEQICEYDGKSISVIKKLCTAEVDCSGNWKLPSLLLDMQELAEQHCNRVGYDFNCMRKFNAAWVLLRLELKFYTKPKLNQEIKLTTSAVPNRHLYHYRYFAGVDNQTGEKLFDVVTHWTVVDLDKRKAILFNTSFPGDVESVEAPFEISRFRIKDKEYDEGVVFTPKFSDYDINRHVNNSRYAEWVVNALDLEKMDTKYLSSVSFVYKAEIPMGQTVKMITHKDGDYFAVRVVSEDGKKTYFECEGTH